ncbi:MAG: Mrp/NBP35 family ATP-binding protein [Phycisphaeraceae bacterium]|nr:Mrp/NBP35 family ATP-binding protein [Phycisphaeraceae bacterium]
MRLDPQNAAPPIRRHLTSAVERAVRELGDEVKQVTVEFVGDPQAQSAATPSHGDGKRSSPTGAGATTGGSATSGGGDASGGASGGGSGGGAGGGDGLPGVSRIIAVGAGKGGVGKSTIAVNLAVGLARAGRRVGILDGDIYGPSLPTLLGLDSLSASVTSGNQIVPFEVHGVKAITLGKLVEAEKPLIWRGPMAHGAFRQLAMQADWGELDYLIIDLPPGTGDVPLTMSQLLSLTGAVVVCTPQKVAQDDARRAVRMFAQLQIPVLGVVENMSYFIADDGKTYDIFGRGGAKVMASEMGVPFLGEVPINMRLRANSDSGRPSANFDDDAQLGAQLQAVVEALEGQVAEAGTSASRPTLTIQ